MHRGALRARLVGTGTAYSGGVPSQVSMIMATVLGVIVSTTFPRSLPLYFSRSASVVIGA